jgi:hypothetical protein
MRLGHDVAYHDSVASTRSPRAKPVFQFFGTADGVLGQITVAQPIQQAKHEWSAHLTMSGPFREDVDVTGTTKKQAVELALGLCHFHVGSRRLLDRHGEPVRVPGKPLPKPVDVGDSTRAEQGLCVCLVDEGNGSVRLVLDDVARDGTTWKATTFYTHKRYQKRALYDLLRQRRDLADIGLAVMVRLIVGAFPPEERRPRSRRKEPKR